MNAIEIRNMYKDFKLVYDKPTTLKQQRFKKDKF